MSRSSSGKSPLSQGLRFTVALTPLTLQHAVRVDVPGLLGAS
jgi:hypothetical protein